jgi:hypothetical protein
MVRILPIYLIYLRVQIDNQKIFILHRAIQGEMHLLLSIYFDIYSWYLDTNEIV